MLESHDPHNKSENDLVSTAGCCNSFIVNPSKDCLQVGCTSLAQPMAVSINKPFKVKCEE